MTTMSDPNTQPIAPPRRNPRRHGPVAQLNESIAPLIVESPRRIRRSPPTAALPAPEETSLFGNGTKSTAKSSETQRREVSIGTAIKRLFCGNYLSHLLKYVALRLLSKKIRLLRIRLSTKIRYSWTLTSSVLCGAVIPRT